MTTETNSNEITSLDEFVQRVYSWHQNRIKHLQHFLTIPDGGGIEIEFEGKDLKLEGEALFAFRAGLSAALDALGTLPFTMVDETEVAQQETPIEILGVDTNDAG